MFLVPSLPSSWETRVGLVGGGGVYLKPGAVETRGKRG